MLDSANLPPPLPPRLGLTHGPTVRYRCMRTIFSFLYIQIIRTDIPPFTYILLLLLAATFFFLASITFSCSSGGTSMANFLSGLV